MLLMICHFEDGLEKLELSAMLYTKVAKYDDTHTRGLSKRIICCKVVVSNIFVHVHLYLGKMVSICFICSPLFGLIQPPAARLCWALVGPRFVLLSNTFSPHLESVTQRKPQTLQREGYEAETQLFSDQQKLGGGFKYFLFSPLLGEMIQFD